MDEFRKFCLEQDMRHFFTMSADALRELIACRYAELWADDDNSLGAHETKMDMSLRAIAVKAAQVRRGGGSPGGDLVQASIPILDPILDLDPIGVSVITPSNSDQAPPEPKLKPRRFHDLEFVKFMDFYPKSSTSQNWVVAYMMFRRATKNEAPADEILEGVHRYREYCEATRSVNTRFVMSAMRFLAQKAWRATWSMADRDDPNPLPPSADELRRRRERRVPRGTKS